MKLAIAYLRVSTDNQDANGSGFDLQQTAIDAFAREAGLKTIATFRDVHTGMGEGSHTERPGLKDAIFLSRKTGAPIVVDGLDRFARNTKTLESLVADGKLKVVSARSGEGAGRAVIMAEAKRAQAEGERIRRTTKEGLARARDRGVRLGNPTNLDQAQRKGAASNKAGAEMRSEQLAPIIMQIRASGKATKQAIADELNRLGHRTSRGKRWDQNNLRRVLERIERREKRDATRDNPNFGIF